MRRETSLEEVFRSAWIQLKNQIDKSFIMSITIIHLRPRLNSQARSAVDDERILGSCINDIERNHQKKIIAEAHTSDS